MKRKKRRTLTGHELDGREGQVMTMHAMGASALKIARCLDVPPHIIRRLIKSNGIIMKNGPASTLEPNRDEIVRLYVEERRTIGEIGARFQVDQTAVWKFLKNQSVTMRSKRQLQVRHIPEIDALYQAGWSIQAIATHLDVTYAPLYRFMEKNRIAIRPRGAHAEGEGNGRWMGAAVSYGAAHDRVRKLRGTPKECERCGTTDPHKRYDWASKTEDYLNPADYERLCKKCHKIDDNKKRRERFGLTTARERFDAKMNEAKKL